MKVKEYLRANGSSPFSDWINQLDGSLKFRIQARILKLRDEDYFGHSKRIVSGLYELKFKNLGGGVRIYFGKEGNQLMILLCGGNKSSQDRDIELAKKYWEDYKARIDEE